MIKVEEHNNLYKDESRNTFVNRNVAEIEMGRHRKKMRLEKAERERELESKVDSLTDDVSRLTTMLEKLLENKNGTN
jgi:hypothetical protein